MVLDYGMDIEENYFDVKRSMLLADEDIPSMSSRFQHSCHDKLLL